MADVVLSYASQDVDRVKPLIEVLESQRWSVWWDYRIRIGRTFDEVIEEELTNAKCILVLWSKESIKSDWVKSEAAEGKKRHILAPALIDEVTIPLEFRRTETAKLYDWDGDLHHPELQLLLNAVAEIIGQKPLPLPPIPPVKKRRLKLIGISAFALFILTIGGIFMYRYIFRGPSLTLEKVTGDGQQIAAGDYKSFVVKVVDDKGARAGAKVAWQTPHCGSRMFVRKADGNGLAEATNMCNILAVGAHTQTAVLVADDTPEGFLDGVKLTPVGKLVEFIFFISEKS